MKTVILISIFHSVATWSSPETTGPRPPPCAGFSFTKIDSSRVVLFGGRQRHHRVNEVHILDMKNWVSRYGMHEDSCYYKFSYIKYSALEWSHLAFQSS